MKKSYRIFIYEIFENLGRIEELCTSISFYFSKIYDIEKNLDKRSKYVNISKQAIFLAIQRSNYITLEIIRKIDILQQNKIIKADKFQDTISELQNMIKLIERSYKNEEYEGIVDKLKEIGERSAGIKNNFQKSLR